MPIILKFLTAQTAVITRTGWAFLGTLAYALSQFLILVVLNKFGNESMVGQFALGLAIVNPIILFSRMGLRALQLADSHDEFGFRDYLGTICSTNLCALGCCGGVALFYRKEAGVIGTVAALALFKAVESVTEMYQARMQKQERNRVLARFQVVRAVLFLTVLALTVNWTGDLNSALFALTLTAVVSLLGLEIRSSLVSWESISDVLPRWQGDVVWQLAQRAWPLGITIVLFTMKSSFPRLFLENQQGKASLGIYAALSYVVMAGALFEAAVGQIATPRLARYNKTGQHKAFRLLQRRTALILGCVGLVGILTFALAGRWSLQLAFGDKYAAHTQVGLWLSVAMAVNLLTSSWGCAATARGLLRGQPIILMIVTTIETGACALLIPSFGLLGAAWAAVIGAVALFSGYVMLNRWNPSTELELPQPVAAAKAAA